MRSSSPLLERQECAGAGVHDAISAIIAEKEGFDFLWLSSFALSAAIGLPDVGLINVEDVLSLVRPLERVTRLPLVVDLDAGHGVPLQTNLVVEKLVRAGVAAVCIEDNPAEKRCSLYDEYDRTLAPVEVHEVRIRAARTAVDARGSNCAVIARTEALVAGLGVDECLRRAAAYADAGADAVFVQSVSSSPDELMEFLKLWNSRTPVFLAPTRYPDLSRSAFFAAGATHVIYAN
ncbi:MAG TPA: isocitrate lyase/PEP mutase family protein, partial [Micromonosporaceae bacterium]|nr:isocitrate lyase/PEP mutase family protein [Micromonosporaceae bacterium]